MKKILKMRKHEQGFSILEVLIAAGIMGIVALGTVTMVEIGNKGSKQTTALFQVDTLKRNFSAVILDDTSWAYTVADTTNTNLDCLRNGTDCNGVTGTIRLRDATNALAFSYDPLSSTTAGFDFNGTVCSTYDDGAYDVGNNFCPFRMVFTWTAMCSGSPCLSPKVKVVGSFTYRPKLNDATHSIPINTAAAGFTVIRGATASTLEATCTMLSGVFDQSDDTCDLEWIKGATTTNTIWNNTGYVGIGTTIPSALLHVYKLTTNTAAGTEYLHTNTLLMRPASSSATTFIGHYSTTSTSGGSGQNITGGIYSSYNLATHADTGTVANLTGQYTRAINSSTGTSTSTEGMYAHSSNTGGGTSTTLYAIRALATSSAGTTTTQYGAYPQSTTSGAATVPNIYGIRTVATHGSSVAATNVFGMRAAVDNTGGATVTTGYGLYLSVDNTSGTMTNKRALYIEDVGSTSANYYALYIAGATAKSYFQGKIGIGITAPTATLHVSPVAAATGTLTALKVTGAANTNQTASTEIPDVDINLARTVEWATGALTTQRAVKIQPPTLSFVGGSTITNAATLGITGAPVLGTNATITNTHGLLISSAAVGAATNSYGLYVNAQSGATNNYVASFMGGNVGIATAAPSYPLHVVGTAGLSTGTLWTNASDIRLKDIRGDYQYGLDEIIRLHPIWFSYKKDNPLKLPSDFVRSGFIAQEVQKIIPEAVTMNKNGYLEFNGDPVLWAMVNAIKKLHSLFDELKSLLNTAYKRLDSHDRHLASLEEQVSLLKEQNESLQMRLKKLEERAPQ